MDKKTLRERIEAQSEDSLNIHAAYKTGDDGQHEYWFVVARKEYEGEPMLKIRYFALSTDEQSEDSWMSNGVTARKGEALLNRLAKDIPAIGQGITEDNAAFTRHDLSDD